MSNTTIQNLIDQFSQIKQKFEIDVEEKRAQFNYQLRKNKVSFEKTLHNAHKNLKTSALRYLANANPLYIVTMPIDYGDADGYVCHLDSRQQKNKTQ